MIIKDKILIGGVVWDITFENLDDADAYGITCFDECKIRLHSEETKKDMVDETFWHEVLHIVHRKAGYVLGDEMKHDESLVISETQVLHQIMNQIIEWQVKNNVNIKKRE